MFLNTRRNSKVTAIGKALLCASVSLPAALIATEVAAQNITSAVRGVITDESGQALANVSVTITHIDSGTRTTATTNNQGGYFARGLRPGGPYVIEVASTSDLQGQRIEGVNLGVNETLPVSFSLAARSSAVEEIIVTAQSVASQNYGGGATTYGSQDIQDIASISRDFKDTIRRNPFVNIDGANNDAISISGSNNRFNSLTVDGIRQDDDFGLNSSGVPTQRTPISIDAIEQIGVNPAPFNVEFGRFQGGSINVVTKSGTNEYHGTVFYQRNSDNWAGSRSRTDDVSLEFNEEFYGATLGGPIVKDKLFFFVNYERFKGSRPNTDGPAGSGRANETSLVSVADVERIAQIAQDVYGFDALGLPPGSVGEEDRKFLAKIDWNINEDHRAFFSYQRTNGNRVVPQNTNASRNQVGLLSNWYNNNERLIAYNFQLFSDWSDNFKTELKVGRKEVRNRQNSFGDLDFAEFTIQLPDRAEVVLGPDEARHANRLNNDLWQVKFKGDYYWGDHVFTAGYELDKLEVFNVFVRRSQGEYRFSSIEDFENRIANRLRYGNSVTGNPDDAAAEFGITTHTFYVQDAWTPTDDLTLVIGGRLDWYQQGEAPLLNQNFLDRNGFGNDQGLDGKTLFQPRFGFTYDFDDRTRVRGGAGLFGGGDPNVWISNAFTVDGITTGSLTIDSGSDPALIAAALNNVDGFDIPQIVQDQIQPGNGPVATTDPNFKVPSSWKFNLAVEREFDLGPLGDGYLVTAEGIWSRTRDAADWRELRRTVVGTAPDGSPIYSAESGYDLILTNTGRGKSDSYAVSVSKAYDNGISFDASYTYQDAKVVNPGTSSTAESNFNFAEHVDRNNRALGTSPFEIKHSIKVNLTYKKQFIEDHDTTFGLFYTGRSGEPFSLTFNQSGTPFGGSSAIDFGDGHLLYIPTVNDPNVVFASAEVEAQFNQLVSDFGLEKYRGQNVPKGHARAPWVNTLDFHFSQEVPFYFGKFELTFDMENLLNFFDSDWGRFEDANFPQITAINVDINDQNQFVYSGTPGADLTFRPLQSIWRMQLGAKYKF